MDLTYTFSLVAIYISGLIQAGYCQLDLASFNIQTFGDTKAGNDNAVQIIADIIHRYDVILLQGIEDENGSAFDILMDTVNMDKETHYNSRLSDRVGDSKNPAGNQQYAFLVRSGSSVELVDVYQHDNSQSEAQFSRPPFAALLQASGTDECDTLVLLGVHMPRNPDNAVQELEHLVSVIEHVQTLWNTSNIIILGDLSASGRTGCNGIPAKTLDNLALRGQSYHWLIDDNVDTRVGEFNCSFNRIVVTNDVLNALVVPGSASPFYFDDEYMLPNGTQPEDISNTYPVAVQFNTCHPDTEDTDTDTEEQDVSTASRIVISCVFMLILEQVVLFGLEI